MTIDDLPLAAGVEAFPNRNAVVSVDVRAVGKFLYLTPEQADKFAAQLMVCASRARSMLPVEEAGGAFD